MCGIKKRKILFIESFSISELCDLTPFSRYFNFDTLWTLAPRYLTYVKYLFLLHKYRVTAAKVWKHSVFSWIPKCLRILQSCVTNTTLLCLLNTPAPVRIRVLCTNMEKTLCVLFYLSFAYTMTNLVKNSPPDRFFNTRHSDQGVWLMSSAFFFCENIGFKTLSVKTFWFWHLSQRARLRCFVFY